MRLSIILSFLWTVSTAANASPLSQGRRTLGLEPRKIGTLLTPNLFLIIHKRATADERWGLAFNIVGRSFFIPEEDSQTPYAPLVTPQEILDLNVRSLQWTPIDLQQVSFADLKHRNDILGKIGKMKMTLNQEFRPSTHMTELVNTMSSWPMPEEFRTPEMDLPQIAYGGPPLQDYLYPAGGTTMNYVRNVLQYLVSERLLKEIPKKFEDEFQRRYQEIWLARWKDTEAGKKVIQILKEKRGVDLLAPAQQ